MTVVFKALISLNFSVVEGIKSNDIYSCLIRRKQMQGRGKKYFHTIFPYKKLFSLSYLAAVVQHAQFCASKGFRPLLRLHRTGQKLQRKVFHD